MSEQEGPGTAPAGDVASSGRDRVRELMADRRALALVGGALVAVIALAAFVVVPALTGSSGSPAANVNRPSTPRTATASPSPSPSPLPTVASQLKVRDPFLPLAVQVAGATGAASVSASASVVATPSVDASQLRQLTLTSITNGTSAKAMVNGLSYDAQLNVPFAGGFAMTALTSSSATFTYKSGTQTLVVGQYAFFS